MNNSCTTTMADLREAYVLSRARDGLRTEGVIAAARADANRAIAAHDKELREKVNPPDVDYSHEWRRGFTVGAIKAARFVEGGGE